jgi:hypothetical protein
VLYRAGIAAKDTERTEERGSLIGSKLALLFYFTVRSVNSMANQFENELILTWQNKAEVGGGGGL